MDKDFILYKLKQIELSGKFYHAIKALYKTSKNSVQINNVASEWFNVTNGVRRGYSLAPALFSIYLNDLATVIKDFNVGVPVADICISYVYASICWWHSSFWPLMKKTTIHGKCCW